MQKGGVKTMLAGQEEANKCCHMQHICMDIFVQGGLPLIASPIPPPPINIEHASPLDSR